jgi:hypothetical protein
VDCRLNLGRRVLVLAPTRELGQQTAASDQICRISLDLEMRVCSRLAPCFLAQTAAAASMLHSCSVPRCCVRVIPRFPLSLACPPRTPLIPSLPSQMLSWGHLPKNVRGMRGGGGRRREVGEDVRCLVCSSCHAPRRRQGFGEAQSRVKAYLPGVCGVCNGNKTGRV